MKMLIRELNWDSRGYFTKLLRCPRNSKENTRHYTCFDLTYHFILTIIVGMVWYGIDENAPGETPNFWNVKRTQESFKSPKNPVPADEVTLNIILRILQDENLFFSQSFPSTCWSLGSELIAKKYGMVVVFLLQMQNLECK